MRGDRGAAVKKGGEREEARRSGGSGGLSRKCMLGAGWATFVSLERSIATNIIPKLPANDSKRQTAMNKPNRINFVLSRRRTAALRSTWRCSAGSKTPFLSLSTRSISACSAGDSCEGSSMRSLERGTRSGSSVLSRLIAAAPAPAGQIVPDVLQYRSFAIGKAAVRAGSPQPTPPAARAAGHIERFVRVAHSSQPATPRLVLRANGW